MEDALIIQQYKLFETNFDIEKEKGIWEQKSNEFHEFWKNKIFDKKVGEIPESEIDQIVRMLDRNAKGNRKGDPAIAKAMIAQGAWRRMFNEIKKSEKLRDLIINILTKPPIEVPKYIDELYKYNEKNKNSLTGKNANALNTMLAAYNPKQYLSVISLNERKKIIEFFKFPSPNFEKDSIGNQIIQSNQTIIEGFQKKGLNIQPRILSTFIYSTYLKEYWKPEEIKETYLNEEYDIQQNQASETNEDASTFYMEKELENFIITNWEKTPLGKELDLIEEDGELVSQQYRTDIGIIDILAKDKKSGQLVIIELKRNQTSDDTVGQLTRYMGWLEEKKTNGQPTKGIIIAGKYDERLHYAIKKLKDVKVYLYEVDFKLRDHN